MRIGIDATGLLAASEGAPSGIINYAMEITRGLLESGSGHEYVVYFRNEIDDGLAALSSMAEFKVLRSGNRKVLQQTGLPIAAASDRLDVMFFPFNSASLFCPTKSVVTIHDLHPFTVPERFAIVHSSQVHRTSLRSRFNQWYWKSMLRHASRRATRVLAVSEVTKKDVESIFGISPEKIDVVHEGAPESFFLRDATDDGADFRAQYKLPERYILGVGTHGYKNVEGSIRAFEIVRKRVSSPIKLVIAGTLSSLGEDKFALVKTLGLQSDVVFTGFFPDEDLNRLYRHAELLLFPSFYEGFGLPVAEAFASGTPVVASTAGALPEVSGGAASLVDPNDVEGIAAAVLAILNDPRCRDEHVRRGLERAQNFTWGAAASGTLRVLERAVDASAVART
jgi:glycosyltransferase involved in cell wall biosynthesis